MKITKKGIAIIESDTHICKWIEESGRLDHDQNMLPYLAKYIRKGDTVIDIGAYVGDHTIFYSRAVGNLGKVLAFEPNKEAFECLTHNLKEQKNTICFNLAIGEKVDRISIDDSCVNKGMAHAVSGNDIEVMPLDLVSIDRLDFMKIDCEGFELQVLIGGEKTIKEHQPVMLIEINDATLNRYGINRQQIFDKLTEFGYIYRNVYKEQSINEAQIDILCIPK